MSLQKICTIFVIFPQKTSSSIRNIVTNTQKASDGSAYGQVCGLSI